MLAGGLASEHGRPELHELGLVEAAVLVAVEHLHEGECPRPVDAHHLADHRHHLRLAQHAVPVLVQLLETLRQIVVAANCTPAWLTAPPPPIGSAEYCDERVCLSVCLSVCLCVCLSAIIYPELHSRSSPTFLCMLLMAVTRSSSGGLMISYVFFRFCG